MAAGVQLDSCPIRYVRFVSGDGGLKMIRNGEISMSEAKRILKKFWWILPLTIVSGGALGMGATFFLPKKFKSQSRVQIHEQTVSPDLIKPVLTEATNQRLASMQEAILSRTQLQAIIEKFGLYPSDRDKMHMEDLVLRLRSEIEVTPPDTMNTMLGAQNHQLPGFYINVTFDNPQVAQRICSEVTTKFLEQNAKYMNDKSTETVEFLTRQAEDAKAKLDEEDAKLADFQKKYMGSLPDQEQANLNLLTTLNSQLEANTQALNRAQQDKAVNDSLLAAAVANWKVVRGGDAAPETLDQQLSALQEQLAALLSRYTAEHPDVVKTRNQIEQLKQRIADQAKTGAPPTSIPPGEIEPPQIQQLRARLKQDDLGIADLTRRQGQIQNQIGALQARIQLSPTVQQQFKELTRNHQSAVDFYNDLLKRRDQAAISRDLTRQQEGEQFSMEDPPSLPMAPSFPKKSIFGGVGLGAGLALGVGVLYLLAALDSSMHTERDVELCLKLPVLTLVPMVDPAGMGRVNRNGKPKGLLTGAAR
jgi:polysaccharide chain length determinant protein (PEP-CTERM system associated)